MGGFQYPNRFARFYLQAIEHVMRKEGLATILSITGLVCYADKYPPDDMAMGFAFDHISALNRALLEMYGMRGGLGLALRIGRVTFSDGLQNFGAMAGVDDVTFRSLPLAARLHIGLTAFCRIFSTFTDQSCTLTDEQDCYIVSVQRCPFCWGQSSERALGHTFVGILQECLRWISGGHEFRVAEVACMAVGDPEGRFVVYKVPIG
jgi:hypothetical protein